MVVKYFRGTGKKKKQIGGTPVEKKKLTTKKSSVRKLEGTDRMKTQEAPVEKKVTTLPPIEAKKIEPEKGIVSKIAQTVKDVVTFDLSKQIDPATGERVKVHAGTLPFGTGGTSFAKTGITLGKAAINTKTTAQVTSWVTKASQAMKNPLVIGAAVVGLIGTLITSSVGGKVFGKFLGMEEATQAISIAGWAAIQNENWEAYEIYREERDDALRDPTFWEKVKEWIPFKNVWDGLMNFREKAIAGGVVLDKVADDRKRQQETGESDDEKWARIREEEKESDKEAIDYYNQQRKQMVQWEREAEKQARNEDAAFWRKEREKQTQMEAEDRKAIADFWLAYRKESLKIANDNRPSNLNFGLL